MAGMAVVYLFLMFLAFLVSIAIMRWAFRINDIVKRLDTLIELQSRKNPTAKSFVDGIKKGME
jgi:predicted tellurium resistance membrane protein TerC